MPTPIVIPFGPFEPDASSVNSNVCIAATGVYPAPVGYTYAPSPTTISSVSATAPLTGGVVIQTSSASAYSLYYGTTNIIRRIDSSALNTANTIATSTQPTSPALWRFAKFGTKLIAVHAGVDALYEDWTAAAAAMSTLGGSPPRASGVFTIGDFVFLTGLASNARSLAWSGINNAESWTPGTNLSDTQEFPDGGDVLGIAGDKSGFVIQQNAIRSFQFLPGDTVSVFSFNKVQDMPGCASINAWCMAGQTLFYYSEEGFCSIGPAGFRRIGAHRVDSYFLAKGVNQTTIRATSDPYGPRVFFSFDSDAGGVNDSYLIYDWLLDKWSEVTNIWLVTFLFEHIDATGGGAQIVHRTSNNFARLTAVGAGFNSSLQTGLMEIFQKTGQRALVTFIRPIAEGGAATVTVASQELIGGTATTVQASTQGANGRFSINAAGTYQKFSIGIPQSAIGQKLTAVQAWVDPAGEA